MTSGSHYGLPQHDFFSHSNLNSPRLDFDLHEVFSLSRFTFWVSHSENSLPARLIIFLFHGIGSTYTTPRVSSSKYFEKEIRWWEPSRDEARCNVSQLVKMHKESIGRIKWTEARPSESLPLLCLCVFSC